MYKSYRYRLYPTMDQKEILEKHFGCCRFVYNWGLSLKTKTYQETRKGVTRFTLCKMLTDYKKGLPWLSEVSAQALQQSLNRLDVAFTRFFRDKQGYPKFKTKRGKQSYSCHQAVKFDFFCGTITMPKIPKIRAVFSRKYSGVVKNVTITRTVSGKFFASVLTEDGLVIPEKTMPEESKAIGIDLGIRHFVTLSTGEKYDNPSWLVSSIERLRILSRRYSKTKIGGKNRDKLRRKIALLHEKIACQRHDFLHKLSSKLVRENQTLCLETLGVKSMLEKKELSLHVSDASWSTFVSMLIYKSDWYGKNILRIGRFVPSSKTCVKCGNIHNLLPRSSYVWSCPICFEIQDRDITAAKNIKRFAFVDKNLINTPWGTREEPAEARGSELGY